eukprot:jgi/Astpho2/6582/e_gw1.00101.178.1_t
MLIAGEEIDATFGERLGLSTLAAAGLGNLVSDVAGLALAERLEVLAVKLGWSPRIAMTTQQKALTITRAARTGGQMIGISVGCLAGMVPLLWYEQRDPRQPPSADATHSEAAIIAA